MLTGASYTTNPAIVCKSFLNYNTSMKVCTICGETKNKNDFFYRNKRTEKLHSQCKNCYIIKRRKIWRDHYHKYGSQYRQRAVERNRRLKNRLRHLMFQYLQMRVCEKCEISDPRVLEFDHIDPASKSFSIARAMNNTVSWEAILLEIKKCQVLCANCHRIKTSEEQGWYKG